MTKICIIGGGSLSHVCAGVLATRPDVEVSILTRRANLWNKTLAITDTDGRVYHGPLTSVSSHPSEALNGCHIALLCLPGYAIESTLQSIRPYVGHTIVGSIVSSTGFFFAAHRILQPGASLFGFQRVPYIARTVDYGHSANLLGYKPQLAIAVEGNEVDAEALRMLVEHLWQTPTRLLASHYEASLTNSNPILHTSRLYSMWHTWDGTTPFPRHSYFYREWTVADSQLLIAMDAEFMQLLRVLRVTPGSIPPILDYYESHDAESLTRKISHIAAFQNILSPMKTVAHQGAQEAWVPDFGSRYFTEDFPYGLRIIIQLLDRHGIPAPTLRRVYAWGMKKISMP